MKFVSYLYHETLHFGAILDEERVVNLTKAMVAFQKQHQLSRPPEIVPADMLAFLQNSAIWWDISHKTVRWLQSNPDAVLEESTILSLAQVKLVTPITNPSKIVCIGLNYHDHCRETNTPVPKQPVTFTKYPSAIIGPDDTITWPADMSSQVDYEAELALVIKDRARNVSEADAYDYIAGYIIANDISARDVQFSEGQWVRAKSFDTFCPLGPYLVTKDEVGDPHDLNIYCRLNGQLVQDSNTSELIFNIPEVIAFITKTCTLLPGDIICTGTPHGTGAFRDPPIYLKPGDRVEVEIEKLGVLRNPVA